MAKTIKGQAKASRKTSEKPKKATTKTVATPVTVKRVEQTSAVKETTRDSNSIPVTKIVAELVGTFVLTMIIIAAVSGNFGLNQFFSPEQAALLAKNGQTPVVLAVLPFIAALAVGILVLVMGKAAWGHFNPAITAGFMALKKVRPVEGMAAIVAQILGAMLALVIALRMFKVVDYNAMRDAIQTSGTSDVVFKAIDPLHLVAHNVNWTLFTAELLGTAIFAFGVASLVAHGREALTRSVIVGGSLLLGLAVAVAAGAGVLNPAVAVGLGLIGFGANAGEIWSLIGIYVAGPAIGGVIGMALYKLIGQQTEDTRLKSA